MRAMALTAAAEPTPACGVAAASAAPAEAVSTEHPAHSEWAELPASRTLHCSRTEHACYNAGLSMPAIMQATVELIIAPRTLPHRLGNVVSSNTNLCKQKTNQVLISSRQRSRPGQTYSGTDRSNKTSTNSAEGGAHQPPSARSTSLLATTTHAAPCHAAICSLRGRRAERPQVARRAHVAVVLRLPLIRPRRICCVYSISPRLAWHLHADLCPSCYVS